MVRHRSPVSIHIPWKMRRAVFAHGSLASGLAGVNNRPTFTVLTTCLLVSLACGCTSWPRQSYGEFDPPPIETLADLPAKVSQLDLSVPMTFDELLDAIGLVEWWGKERIYPGRRHGRLILGLACQYHLELEPEASGSNRWRSVVLVRCRQDGTLEISASSEVTNAGEESKR